MRVRLADLRVWWSANVFRVVFYALLLAVVIRTFIFQPFNIPSGSMENTLLVGDYFFVTKFSYGYSHHSLPWSPRLFSGRVRGVAMHGDAQVVLVDTPGIFKPRRRLDRAMVQAAWAGAEEADLV
ncbi:MAG: S26 family signal peptidase, partial [Alphaproteobacteria bacterium]